MPDRLILIDTDMVVLLGGSGSLPDVLQSLEFAPAQARRLAAATAQLQRGKAFKDNYTAAVLQAALRAARAIEPLTERPEDSALLDNLARVPNIDDGEAQLFALLAEHDGWYLSTGDKRALISLATRNELVDLRERVAGRIVCLESVLKLLVQRNGARPTAQAFLALRTHKTINVLLSDPQTRSDYVCLQGIQSYLDDLIAKTGQDFLYLPEVTCDGT